MKDSDIIKLSDDELDKLIKILLIEKMIRTSTVWRNGKKYSMREIRNDL